MFVRLSVCHRHLDTEGTGGKCPPPPNLIVLPQAFALHRRDRNIFPVLVTTYTIVLLILDNEVTVV